MTGQPLRVVVAEDHPVFRQGVLDALTDRGVEVVAAVATGEDAVTAADTHAPDVVLMDLTMPGAGGLAAIRDLLDRDPPTTRVLVLTMSHDDASVFAALRAGAAGYLLKEADADEIVRAVHTVAAGGTVLGPRIAATVLDAATAPATDRRARPFPHLTDREFEVLGHLASGWDNARIAGRLGIATKTVRNQVSNVLAKLGVATRAEAGALARDAGLDPPVEPRAVR